MQNKIFQNLIDILTALQKSQTLPFLSAEQKAAHKRAVQMPVYQTESINAAVLYWMIFGCRADDAQTALLSTVISKMQAMGMIRTEVDMIFRMAVGQPSTASCAFAETDFHKNYFLVAAPTSEIIGHFALLLGLAETTLLEIVARYHEAETQRGMNISSCAKIWENALDSDDFRSLDLSEKVLEQVAEYRIQNSTLSSVRNFHETLIGHSVDRLSTINTVSLSCWLYGKQPIPERARRQMNEAIEAVCAKEHEQVYLLGIEFGDSMPDHARNILLKYPTNVLEKMLREALTEINQSFLSFRQRDKLRPRILTY